MRRARFYGPTVSRETLARRLRNRQTVRPLNGPAPHRVRQSHRITVTLTLSHPPLVPNATIPCDILCDCAGWYPPCCVTAPTIDYFRLRSQAVFVHVNANGKTVFGEGRAAVIQVTPVKLYDLPLGSPVRAFKGGPGSIEYKDLKQGGARLVCLRRGTRQTSAKKGLEGTKLRLVACYPPKGG